MYNISGANKVAIVCVCYEYAAFNNLRGGAVLPSTV